MLNAKNLFQRFGSGFMLAMMSLSALGSAAPAVAHARNEMNKTSENTRTVTLAGSENGALTFGDSTDVKKKFNIGDEVTLNVKPKDGYSVEQIYVVDSNQELVDSKQDANEVKFTMPDHDVKVYSNFKSGANAIRGPTKYTKGDVSITKDDGSELSFNENDYSEGSKFDLNVKFKDGHVPVSILLKDGKGNVLKDVKMSKNGDSIKYSVEKAPKSLDVFVMTTDIKNLVSEKSDSNYQGEDLTYDGFKKKLNKIDKSKVPNLKDPERVGLFVVKHTMFDESVITEKDRFTDLYKDASDIKTYDMKKVSALLGQVSEETLVYDVSNDSDYYVTYVRPFDDSKVNSVEMAENNIAGYLVNDIHYDMESGLAYIPKKYFDNYKQHNKEATVDNLSPVQMQFMERRKGDRKLPVRVNMHADGNFSSDLVSSEVLNTRIDEEKLTVKLPKKVSLSDVLVVANGIPVANSALYVSDGVLTIAQKSATYGTVDIYYRDGSKLISYFGSKFDDRLTQYGQKDEYSKIEPNTLIPTAYAVSVGDLSYNAGNARFSSDVNIGDIFTLTGYSYPKPSAVENASSTGAYPSGVWGYGGTTSSGVPASTASVLNWIVGRGGSQPGHVVEPPSNGSNNSVEIFGHTYFFSPTGEGGAGTGVAHTRGMEFNGETLTGSSGSVTLNSSGMITVGCYHIAVNGESNVIVRGGDGRPYDSRTMYLRVADIQVGPDGSGYVVFGMYLPMYGSQSGGGFFKMTAQIPPRKGDYRVRKSFESVKSNYYNKQATFIMTPINIANQGVVTKTVNGDGEILFEDLMAGQYVLTESAGNGFEPTMSQTVTVIAGQKGYSAPSSNISNRAKRGNFNLQKDTGDNYISGKNKNYSLAGAQYELILKNDNSLKYTLTTNEQGQAGLQNIERGEYTLREVSAPRGYALNTQGEDVSVTNETNGKQTRDNPRYDPVVLTLEKADKERNALNASQYGPQGNASLVGAVFTLTLYEENNLTEAQIKAGQGTKLWSVDITTKDVNGKAVAKTSDKSYLSNYVPYKTDAASLDNIFDPRAGLKIAGGTFAVVEKSAPTGYLVDGVQFNGKGMYVKQVRTEGYGDLSRVTVEQPTNETVKAAEDKKTPGRLKFNKKDADSHGIVPQGDAEMKTTTFDVYNKSKNPIVYDGREYAVDAKVTTVTVDPTTLVASLRNELPYGEYEVVEASTHESYHKSAPTQRATLDDNHRDMDLTFENQVKRGSIEIKKHDADTDSTTPQGDATLQATYTIKNKSKNPVFVNGQWYAKDAVITTVTTDASSKTVKVGGLPVGAYLVEETGTNDTYHLGGYDRDKTTKFAETVHITPAKLEVKLTTIKGENETIAPENFVKRGSIKVEKHDNQTNNITPQGDAKLKATFNVVNKSANAIWYYTGTDRTKGKLVKPNEVVDTITTDDKTRIATITNLPVGTYEVIETAASESYDINPYRRTVKVTAEKLDHLLNNANQGANDAAAANIVKRGGVQVKKIDNDFVRNEWAQGDAGFAGAEFTIINRSAEAVYNKATGQKYDVGATVAVIRANDKGVAASGLDTLPIGTYEIYESKAPTGYLLNEKWRKTFTVRPANAGTFIQFTQIPEKANHNIDQNNANDKLAIADKVIRGDVRVHKFDHDRNTTDPKDDSKLPQGDATLEGAKLEVINKSPHHVFYNGKEYAPNDVIDVLTTDVKGDAGAKNLPYGTYMIREKSAPTGYLVNSEWTTTFSIRENGKVVEANSETTAPLNEKVIRGFVKVQKVDKERTTNRNENQGDATLAGAVISVINESKEAVYVNGKWHAKGEVVATMTTNDKGIAVLDNNASLPYGSYSLKETKASEGYLLNDKWKVNFQIREDNKVVDVTSQALEQQIIRGDVEVIKQDLELSKSEAIAGKDHNGANGEAASLNGITFEVRNASAKSVNIAGKFVNPGEVVTTLVTKWNAERKQYMVETTGKYLPYGTYTVQEIATNNSYVLTDGAKRTFTIRKDGEVVKADKENKPLVFKNQVVRSDFEFVKIVDTTSERLHTVFTLTNVTTGERHVIVTDKNGEYYTDSTKGFEHDKETNANDGLLAKIDAKEMIYMKDVKNGTGTWFGNAEDGSKATPNNKLGALPFGKYKLQEVRTDTNTGLALQSFEFYVYRHERTVHGGTVTDDRVPPKVGTQALDKETNDHVGQAQGKRIITDRVKYQGARMYKEYTVEGTLMNAETGAPILVGGKPVKAKKTFKAEQTDGYVDIEFVIEDASVLLGTKTVAFEDLLEGEIKVASHADINDEDQSVYYPKVKTSASDKATNDRITTHGGKQIFVDTVKYTNLLPGKEYTVKGTLMDKETKKPLIVDGKPVTSETKFKPEKKDGEVKLEFEVETKELSGKQIVVFERVEYGGKVVGVHEDIEDVEQTVNVPGLKTNASSKTTGSQMAPAKDKEVIVDKVTYKNLIVGKEYTIKGKLMNKATGKPVEGAEASKTFVADKKDGFVELEFVVDASKLAGETVVAFERLEFNKIDIAFHEDIEDNDQSVNIPKVGTKAQGKETGNNIVPAVGNQVIVDTVEYKNLIVGKEYTVEGKLMDKTTGKELLVDGKPVVGSTTFTPKVKDGKVEIEFTVPAEKLAGTSLVVFEDVLHGGKLVGFHHDINDEEQTVNIPHIGTTAKNKDTNTHTADAGKKQTIVDTVRYKNLVVGKEYTMTGQLMKKVNDGKPSEVGKEVTVKFTPKEKDGSIDLTFEVDLDELAGETVVAFETLKEGKVTIAVHHDINDENQSVNIPKLKTNASDKTTGTQQVADTKERVIVDKVTYHNLRVGETYTVEGVLMDKETGKPLLVDGNEVKATKEFQPTEKDGVVELEFTIPEASLQGKTLVVFEDLLQDGKKVGTHSDINDEDQSVHVLKVGTTATAADGKTKELGSVPETKLKDFVKYENLKVGEKVYVEGRVHDKSTGEVLKDADGKEIVVRTEFEPKTANGVLEMEFTLDTSNLVDKELVVTEKVFNAKGVLIGEHFDLNDKGQTVKVLPKPETVKPNTGVDSIAGIVAMISVMAMVIGVAFIVLARRRNI